MPHRFISAMSSKLRLWLLVALLLIMQCPSLSIAATELDGSTTAPGEVQPKKYCHGYQTSCPLEAPLKIHQPEHNQNYQWTFSSSGDPRGPALFPNIDIDLLPPSGTDPALDAALTAVRTSAPQWQLCLRLQTGRGTDAALDVPNVGHHWCSPLDVLPELVLYPLDGLGNASASNLPMAITPCRLSLWLEPTPAAWADANDDATIGVLNDDVAVNSTKSKSKGTESKASVLAAHAAELPGRSIDWVVWSSAAPLPTSYFWESTQTTSSFRINHAISGSSLKSSLDTARSAKDRAKDPAQIESKPQELALSLTQHNLNASDLFWSHEEAYDLLPMKEPSKKAPTIDNDPTESSAGSSDSIKHCPVEASPAFESVAHFGSALSAALNDRFGGSFPFSDPLVFGEPSFTAPQTQSNNAHDYAFDGSFIDFHSHNDAGPYLPYLLLVGCGYSGTRAMAAFLSQHLELPVRHEFGNLLDAAPNAPGFLGPYADSVLHSLAPMNQTHFTSYEAAAEAALALIDAGESSLGGITGSSDGVWTLREGTSLQPSTLGETSYLVQRGPRNAVSDNAAAVTNRTSYSTKKLEEIKAGVETPLDKRRRALLEKASTWAGMAAWPMTIRLGALPPERRVETFLMVRHPLKVVRSAQATKWTFVYAFAAGKEGEDDQEIEVVNWVPLSFADVWNRLPVAFRSLLWWSSFNLLGEAQLPVGRKPFRMEDVFELGNTAPLKEMHAAVQGDKSTRERNQAHASRSARKKETEMEILVEATTAGSPESTSAAGGSATVLNARGSRERTAAPAPLAPSSSSASHVIDWDTIGAAAVTSPLCHAHAGASKKKARAEVTWDELWALQGHEAGNGDCAVAVAMEAVLEISQQLCRRYGYASSSCQPTGYKELQAFGLRGAKDMLA